MKNINYYMELKRKVDEGFQECQELFKEYDKMKEKRERGIYSMEYLNQTILPKMNSLKKNVADIQKRVLDDSKRLTELMKEELKKADTLNPSELTEDVKLFQDGLILREKDIEGILERNSNNRTMTQLALRYAEDHGMKINSVYLSAESDASAYDSFNNAVGTVVKWFDENNEKCYRNVYNVVFNPSSEEQFRNSDIGGTDD